MNFFSSAFPSLNNRHALSCFIFFYIFSSIIYSGYAQSDLNSLKSQIESFHARRNSYLKDKPVINTRDTALVRAFNTFAWELRNVNPDTAIILSKQALQLVENFLLQFSESSQPMERKAILKEKANVLRNLGYFHWIIGNSSLALNYYERALTLSKLLNDERGVSIDLGKIGVAYSEQGNNSKALEYYFKALGIATKLRDNKGMEKHLSNIGSVYFVLGDYPRALEYYFKSIEIIARSGVRSGMSSSLGNIGSVYNLQGNYPKALEYYFKALEIEKTVGDKNGMESELGNIGTVYHKMAEKLKSNPVRRDSLLKMAMNNYFKALEIAISTRRKIGIGTWLGNIGVAYHEQENYTLALEYYFKALENAKETGHKFKVSIWLGNIGELYIDLKRYSDAEDYLNQSIAVAEEIGSIDDIKEFQQSLSVLNWKLAEKSPNPNEYYLKALEHFKISLMAGDTIANEEKSDDIGKMEARHELALADIERELQEKEAVAIAVEVAKKRDRLQYLGIFTVLFVIILTVLLFLFARLNIPLKVKNLSVFITLLFLFEFVLLVADTRIDKITGGDPFFKLAINAIFALGFYFIQGFTQKILFAKIRKAVSELSEQGLEINAGVLLVCVISFISMSAFMTLEKDKNRNEFSKTKSTPGNIQVDSLKQLLNNYQNQISLFCNNKKYKEAYEVILEMGVVKDSLYQLEKTQEFARVNEKQNIEIQIEKKKAMVKELAKKEAEKKKRNVLLKYSIIFIIISFLFIGVAVISTGRKRKLNPFIYSILSRIPQSYLKGGLFVSFLLLFEFIIVLTEPWVDQYAGGAPALKLISNMIIALCISPLHVFLEEKMKEQLERKTGSYY